jgi:hypothetical protein
MGMNGATFQSYIRFDGSTMLAVRSVYVPSVEIQNNQIQQVSSSPALAADDVGGVTVYQQNFGANSMSLLTKISSPGLANGDWFGAGIAVMDSPFTNETHLYIGSPRNAGPIRRIIGSRDNISNKTTWQVQNIFLNPSVAAVTVSDLENISSQIILNSQLRHTYFGGVLSANDNTLLISDSVSSTGLGRVYVLFKRKNGKCISGVDLLCANGSYVSSKVTDNQNSAGLGQITPSQTIFGGDYEWVAELVKDSTLKQSAPYKNLLRGSDHFGAAIAMLPERYVIGSPGEGCVYTYSSLSESALEYLVIT